MFLSYMLETPFLVQIIVCKILGMLYFINRLVKSCLQTVAIKIYVMVLSRVCTQNAVCVNVPKDNFVFYGVIL